MEPKQKLFRAVMRACILVLCLMCAAVFARVFAKKVLVGKFGVSSPVIISFAADGGAGNAAAQNVPEGTLLRDFTLKVKRAEDRIVSAVTGNLPFYTAAVEWANRIERTAGLSLTAPEDYNAAEDLGGGYLVNRAGYETRQDTERLLELTAVLRKTGVPFLYAALPNKLCKTADAGYDGVLNFDNAILDERLVSLEAEQTETFDLRAAFHAAGADHHSLFFNTDHHWRPETACAAGGMIAAELSKRFGAVFDGAVFDLGNYKKEVYRGIFLGSIGKKLTLAKAGTEDLNVYTAAFDTAFRVRCASQNIDETGTHEVLFDKTHLEPGDIYKKSPYTAFARGNFDLIEIENLGKTTAPKVLFIGDSFDNSMACFFANACSQLTLMDLRMWKSSSAALEWVAANAARFDAVVVSGGHFTPNA